LKFLTLLLFFVLSSCATPVDVNVSEDYLSINPRVIAVLPVFGDVNRDGARELFRTMAARAAARKGYAVLDFEATDAALSSAAPSSKDGVVKPGDAARLLNVDAVLVIDVMKWKERAGAVSASLKIKTRFALYDTESFLLWDAEYSTKESGITLDKDAIEFSVVKAYEPRIQRVVDAVMSTLPQPRRAREKGKFFDWLP
jgi:hypothetical protein